MSSSLCLHNGTLLTGFSVMENCAVLIENGRIEDVFSEKRFAEKHFDADVRIIDVGGAYVSPGFIDTHIHGFKGRGVDEYSEDAILAMSENLAQYGVTAFNPTFYPSSEENMKKGLKAAASAMKHAKGAKIMGVHLEGPFISPDKLGVQRPETVRPVDLELMDRLWKASEGHIVNMTVAPELKGMRYLALNCLKKGIVLQAGHTNAEYRNMVEGMQAGILHSTHLFNAMSQLHHRNPGAVGAILIHPEMSCEIVADGIHVHPDLIKLLMRDKALDKIVLVTDALTPTEQTSGTMLANGEEVVFKDGCFHRASDDVIAGSALTMIKGVQNLASYGFSLGDAVKCATANPAAIMGFHKQGMIIPGYTADITVFDRQFNVLMCLVDGAIKKNIL
ncbi:MAG: N-acetylglucosamine-6-phosphate deacetylase [Treponemataceae bacterium]|nr:N-acetylglucosamine-6-phosphate deacetylase [Treponemataceae bacterium]